MYLFLDERQRQLVNYVQREEIHYNTNDENVSFFARYRNNLTDEAKNSLLVGFIDDGKKGKLLNDIDKKIYECLDDTLL